MDKVLSRVHNNYELLVLWTSTYNKNFKFNLIIEIKSSETREVGRLPTPEGHLIHSISSGVGDHLVSLLLFLRSLIEQILNFSLYLLILRAINSLNTS